MTINFSTIEATLTEVLTELFPVIATGEWTSWSLEDQQALRALMNQGNATFGPVLRVPFDQTIYKGHVSGAVSTEVKPIRAPKTPSDTVTERKVPDALSVLKAAMAR